MSLPPLLALDEPPPYGVVNPDGTSEILLLCEHALPRVPRSLAHLGLPRSERLRHIGWDIGALAVAQHLAASLDAALFHTSYSRLVVDCNRPLDNPALMPQLSETTPVPGNAGLSDAERAQRIDTLFSPFSKAVSRRLDLRQAAGLRSFVVGVHSYTPVYKGVDRPWKIGVLHAGDTPFGKALLAALAEDDQLNPAENQPYQIDGDDYTVPVHGISRGLPSLLIEIRHDLIDNAQGATAWGERLSGALLRAVAEMA